MAILNNITEEISQYGVAFNDAYYRIADATIIRTPETAPKFVVNMNLYAYATSTPDNLTREVGTINYQVDLEEIEALAGVDFLTKCYTWVMAQEGMTNSKEA